jgi:LacI family transcriptional regulator
MDGPGRRRPSKFRGSGQGVSSRDVADRAKVSQSTVSRVINDRSNVLPETRRRVERAMAELGYVPNAAARTLITNRSQLIGLVVSNITNGFHPAIIESVTSAALAEGYTVIVGNTPEGTRDQAAFLRILAEHRADGVILTTVPLHARAVLQPLLDARLPMVLANRRADDIATDSVTVDEVKAGRIATDHLIEHGRRRIAYAGGRPTASTDRDKFLGYEASLQAAGLVPDPRLIQHGYYTYEWGHEYIRGLLDQGVPFDGVVAGDDMIALGCMDALAESGRSVPEDVAVIGSDDIVAASFHSVGLTTIDHSTAAMGQIAVQLLLRRIRESSGPPVMQINLEPALVLRRSCGVHEASDPTDASPDLQVADDEQGTPP